MNLYTSRKAGFTLNEILVVIAILAILSSVVLISTKAAREKARDTQRISDLQQIQLALRVYKDANGRYPDMGCDRYYPTPPPGGTTAGWTGQGTGFGSCDVYIKNFSSYFNTLPLDPKNAGNNTGYIYSSRNDGQAYKIMAYKTVERGDVQKGTEFARCPSSCIQSYCSENTYAIYSKGAECW